MTSDNKGLLLIADLFTNKARFDAGFSERLKLKDDTVLTILDLTVILQHKCEKLFSLRDHYCFVCLII